MPLTIDQPQYLCNFDQFLTRYGGNNRYELIDGDVLDLEPKGQHEEVCAFITAKLCIQIAETGLPWFVLQRVLLRPASTAMTAFRPDVAVVDRDELRLTKLFPLPIGDKQVEPPIGLSPLSVIFVHWE